MMLAEELVGEHLFGGRMRGYKYTLFTVFFGWVVYMSHMPTASGTTQEDKQVAIRLHVVFNNVSGRSDLQTGWGFACWVDGLSKTLLFDTGGDGDILLSNMSRLGFTADAVEAIVLSHIHGDHTGGLAGFLDRHSDVTVYMPESFPASFQHQVESFGASIETVSGPRRLFGEIHSTGQMGTVIKEQGVILDTRKGLVVVTGCAHPNVADMAERATKYLDKDIYLLMGGFHLGGARDEEIQEIIQRLRAIGVRKVAPSHCTGRHAIQMFRKEWGDDFLEGGLGAVIE